MYSFTTPVARCATPCKNPLPQTATSCCTGAEGGGDKLGLYGAIIDEAVSVIQDMNEEIARQGRGLSPAERLRYFVGTFLTRVARLEGRALLLSQLIRHEISEPSPLSRRLLDQGLAPRLRYLSEIVAELLERPMGDEAVRFCTLSVHAQCITFMRDALRTVAFRRWQPATPEELARAVEHVTAFSLAGIAALRARR